MVKQTSLKPPIIINVVWIFACRKESLTRSFFSEYCVAKVDPLDCEELLRGVGGLELDLAHLELQPLEPGQQAAVHRPAPVPALARGGVVDALQPHANVVRELRWYPLSTYLRIYIS